MRSHTLKLFRNGLRLLSFALAAAGLVILVSRGLHGAALIALSCSLLSFIASHLFHRRYRRRKERRPMINVF